MAKKQESDRRRANAGAHWKPVAVVAILLAATQPAHAINRFIQRNLVSSDVEYCPKVMLRPSLLNAWGVAVGPAGPDSHFWVPANLSGASFEFKGDVGGVQLQTDALNKVRVPGPNGAPGTPTGVVYNTSTGFVITQDSANGPITAPAKILFATDNGTISAWTERARGDGGFDRPAAAKVVIGGAGRGSQYFGLAISPVTQRLFVADFGKNPQVRVYDGQFNEITAQMPVRNPFVGPLGPKPGDFVPFNVQVLDDGAMEHLFVMYTRSQEDPAHPGHILPGEEDSASGHGRLVEYDTSGNLVAIWKDRGMLDSPWAVAYAPADFGLGDHALIVGNFGDGTAVAFNTNLKQASYFLQDPFGNAIRIEGLWGMHFGDGVAAGRANELYFGAGPDDETEGVFGKLLPQFPVTTESRAALSDWMAEHQRCTQTIDGQTQQATCAIPCTEAP